VRVFICGVTSTVVVGTCCRGWTWGDDGNPGLRFTGTGDVIYSKFPVENTGKLGLPAEILGTALVGPIC
jgi:hypothetical protein